MSSLQIQGRDINIEYPILNGFLFDIPCSSVRYLQFPTIRWPVHRQCAWFSFLFRGAGYTLPGA